MIVVLVLSLISILWGVVFLRVPRARQIVGTEPRCAACGYIVHGLPGQICPECGADLAQPKAIVIGSRRPLSRIVRTISWTLFCLMAVEIPGCMTWQAFIETSLPLVKDDNVALTLSQPASNAYRSIELHSTSHGLQSPNAPLQPPYHVTRDTKIKLTRSDGSTRTAIVDDAAEHFRDVAKPDFKDALALDASGLTTWLQANGVVGNAEQINREMQKATDQMRPEILGKSRGIYNDGSAFSSIGLSSGGSSRTQPWIRYPPHTLTAVVWLIGLVWITRKPTVVVS